MCRRISKPAPGNTRVGSSPQRTVSSLPDEAKTSTCLTRDSSLHKFCPTSRSKSDSRFLTQCGSDTRALQRPTRALERQGTARASAKFRPGQCRCPVNAPAPDRQRYKKDATARQCVAHPSSRWTRHFGLHQFYRIRRHLAHHRLCLQLHDKHAVPPAHRNPLALAHALNFRILRPELDNVALIDNRAHRSQWP